MGLLSAASVAIDASKFKAVNNRDRNFTRAKMARRRAQIEASVARYLQQLDTADRQEPSVAIATKSTRLKEKIPKLGEEMERLAVIEAQMLAAPDQQVSLTDPDARSMATSGRGSGVVGYNVQVAVDTEHHLIVTHEVTNVGSDRSQLVAMAKQAQAALRAERLDAVADRGYFNGEEILACEQAGIAVTLPKPMTSGAKAEGRFGKQDFVYQTEEDVYHCPAGATLKYYYTNIENGLRLRRYWTNVCPSCTIKSHCTPAKQRRITRWEHEHVLEAVQRRLDENPKAMRQRRETVEHSFGTIKARMGAVHFLMKTLPRVAGEMALHASPTISRVSGTSWAAGCCSPRSGHEVRPPSPHPRRQSRSRRCTTLPRPPPARRRGTSSVVQAVRDPALRPQTLEVGLDLDGCSSAQSSTMRADLARSRARGRQFAAATGDHRNTQAHPRGDDGRGGSGSARQHALRSRSS
jgi:Transposase DDE domain